MTETNSQGSRTDEGESANRKNDLVDRAATQFAKLFLQQCIRNRRQRKDDTKSDTT